jgi:hypothetical protein
MAQNFRLCDRDQALLMPPSLRDWLGQDELAWCVLDVVAEMDLSAIFGEYRADGHGRATKEAGAGNEVTQAALDANAQARLDGLRAGLTVLILIAALARFFVGRMPTRQPGSEPARGIGIRGRPVMALASL